MVRRAYVWRVPRPAINSPSKLMGVVVDVIWYSTVSRERMGLPGGRVRVAAQVVPAVPVPTTDGMSHVAET